MFIIIGFIGNYKYVIIKLIQQLYYRGIDFYMDLLYSRHIIRQQICIDIFTYLFFVAIPSTQFPLLFL